MKNFQKCDYLCMHRLPTGEACSETLKNITRQEAFAKAACMKWQVIEMRPIINGKAKHEQHSETHATEHTKAPSADEIKLLLVRKNCFWIGVISGVLPLIGLLLGLCVYLKHDVRGIKCWLYGLWFVVFTSLICGIVYGFAYLFNTWIYLTLVGLICCWRIYALRHTLANKIMLGFTLPKNAVPEI